MRYYFAPLEGITDSIFRCLHSKYFSGIDRCYRKRVRDWATVKSAIKNDLSGYLFKTTKRNPMILPVITEI